MTPHPCKRRQHAEEEERQHALHKHFFAAATRGDLNQLQADLRFQTVSRDTLNESFVEAAAQGHLECLKFLKPHTQQAVGDDPLFNALVAAARSGHLPCVDFLIPFVPPCSGSSLALRWAARNGHLACLKALLPVSDPTISHSEPLQCAFRNHDWECVRFLIPFSDIPTFTAYMSSHEEDLSAFKVLYDDVQLQAQLQAQLSPAPSQTRQGL